MKHRHLDITVANQWGLAALDDRISRGNLADWVELLPLVPSQPNIQDSLWRIVHHYPEPDAQSYRFFERILEHDSLTFVSRINWNWLDVIYYLSRHEFNWEDLLSAASRLQTLIPSATLVGGTATALHCHHPISWDTDHVLPNLREQFDQVLADLESVAGWEADRCQRPVPTLGSLDGIETGIRSRPLEMEVISTPQGKIIAIINEITTEVMPRSRLPSPPAPLPERERGENQNGATPCDPCSTFKKDWYIVPTVAEMLRIKSFLILRRNATRDYLDTVALAEVLGDQNTWFALQSLDEYYPQPNGQSPLQQLLRQLAQPLPFDLDTTDLRAYKQLSPCCQRWLNVEQFCHHLVRVIAQGLVESKINQESEHE